VLSIRDNEFPTVIAEAIERIASDNTSGAAEILRRAGELFALLDDRAPAQDANFEPTQQTVIETCTALALAQPEMTPLFRLASAALSAARGATNRRAALKTAKEAALNFIAIAERDTHEAVCHAANLIRDGATILTHSRSSTVLAAFVEASHSGRDFSVIATESRPMQEGRVLAATLASLNVPVTLIADAAAALAMDAVALVVLGADKITPLNLTNKIGTRMVALAARERGLPLYAVCDSSKFIRVDYLGSAIRRTLSPDELWPNAPRGVAVVNNYFEPTPLEFFTGIVTEDGTLSVTEAARRAEHASIDNELLRALGIPQDGIK
jgi:translation initiation factor 2B subunit (eIF-2B alpha/beta/delta family)